MNQSARNQPTSRPATQSPRPGRVEEAFHKARRHSGRVRALKFGLPLVAVVMAAGFAAKSWISVPLDVAVSIGGTAIEDGRLVMSDPKLEGFTSDDRAYTMTAKRAIQTIGAQDRVDLEGIDARLPFEGDKWMTVKAQNGTFDRGANTLDLDSQITMVTDTGIKAMLKSAKVDIAAGHLDTSDPVDITMDGTRIEAESLSVRDKGAVMIFDRRVRVVIDPNRLQTAASQDGTRHEN